MRLGDLDALFVELWRRGNPFDDRPEVHPAVVWSAAAMLAREAPTINPENLPIVWELREELARVTAERDAAVEQLRGYCPACKSYTENHCEGSCEDCKHEYYQYRSKNAMDNWEWRGPQKEE